MTEENRALSVGATDYHTAGEPFRIVGGGVGPIPGESVPGKRSRAIENLDRVKRLLVYEPRGHADMYGCFVTEPDDADGDLGVLFFHNAGFSTDCGHGTIGLATWAIESGVVAPGEPETRMTIDVPSAVWPSWRGSRREAGLRALPQRALLRALARPLRGDRFGGGPFRRGTVSADEVVLDVAFGDAFHTSADTRALGLAVEPANPRRFVELGREIKDHLNATAETSHPLEPRLRVLYGTNFFEEAEGPGLAQRNVTVFADGEVDRSRIVGTRFEGRVVEETEVAGTPPW